MRGKLSELGLGHVAANTYKYLGAVNHRGHPAKGCNAKSMLCNATWKELS